LPSQIHGIQRSGGMGTLGRPVDSINQETYMLSTRSKRSAKFKPRKLVLVMAGDVVAITRAVSFDVGNSSR
jgi:hypothetical protein